MQTFDEIYVLDLHGNSKKKETVPGSGEPDKNVFDIQQGVAIGIFVKLPKKNPQIAPMNADSKSAKSADKLATVYHCDLWGAKRQAKYEWLSINQVQSTKWTKLEPAAPLNLFIPRDTKRLKEYERGWKATEMMPVNVLGFQSHRDGFALALKREELRARMAMFRDSRFSDHEINSAVPICRPDEMANKYWIS